MRHELRAAVLGLGFLGLAGCSSSSGPLPVPGGPRGDVIVVGEERGRENRGARSLHVPPGHYPPPGECRIWYPDRPPGHQPPPARCDRLVGRIPLGAFILYNDKAWDTRHDWRAEERRNRGSVPGVILQLMDAVRG